MNEIDIYNKKGKVKFSTPAAVVLRISATVFGVAAIIFFFDTNFETNSAFQYLTALISFVSNLWLINKRVRLPFYIMIASSLGNLIYNSVWTEPQIAIGPVGLFMLIYFLIRKQWAYMPLYSNREEIETL